MNNKEKQDTAKLMTNFLEFVNIDESLSLQALRVESYLSMQLDSVIENEGEDFETLYFARDGGGLWIELFFTNPGIMVYVLSNLKNRYPEYSFIYQGGKNLDKDLLIVKNSF